MEIHPHTEHKDFSIVRHNDQGLPICHICGAAHKKLMTHVVQVHEMSAKEYKLTYGLDLRKGIVCEQTRDKLRKALDENWDTSVNQNLLGIGRRYRYTEGHSGSYVSPQSLNRLSILNDLRKAYSEARRLLNKESQTHE
jgi:hypothetical protein